MLSAWLHSFSIAIPLQKISTWSLTCTTGDRLGSTPIPAHRAHPTHAICFDMYTYSLHYKIRNLFLILTVGSLWVNIMHLVAAQPRPLNSYDNSAFRLITTLGGSRLKFVLSGTPSTSYLAYCSLDTNGRQKLFTSMRRARLRSAIVWPFIIYACRSRKTRAHHTEWKLICLSTTSSSSQWYLSRTQYGYTLRMSKTYTLATGCMQWWCHPRPILNRSPPVCCSEHLILAIADDGTVRSVNSGISLRLVICLFARNMVCYEKFLRSHPPKVL